MSNKIIKPTHAYILTIMSTGFMVHVLILPTLLTTAKRDAWVSVLWGLIPIIIIGSILFYISRLLKQQSLFAFLKDHYSTFIVKSLAIGLAIVLFSEAFVTMKYTLLWAEDNYTSEVPDFIIVFTFSIICFYASFKGIKTIAILGPIIFFFVSLFGFFIGFSNIPKKDYTLLFPLFEQGFEPSLKGIIYVLAGVGEILFLLLLQCYSRRPYTWKGVILTSLFLIVLLLGPLLGAIAAFGYEEAAKMNNPAYEEWKLLSIGRYITRADFLSIFQWFSGCFVRISLFLFLTNEIIWFNKKGWSLLIIYSLFIIGVLINWHPTSFFLFLHNLYFPVVGVMLFVYTFLIFLLVKHKSR